jgi:cytochrome c-type biogenesis protein
MPKTKTIILTVIIIAVIAAILFLDNPFTTTQPDQVIEEGTGKNIGDTFINVQLQDLQQSPTELAEFIGPNVLIVNAWAAWCPFCINEMPDMQAASDKFGDDVEVIFVHRTSTEDSDKAIDYLNRFEADGTPITDTVLLDPSENFYSSYFGFGMPVTVFIDENGIIQDKKVGPLTPEELDQKIEALLQ